MLLRRENIMEAGPAVHYEQQCSILEREKGFCIAFIFLPTLTARIN